MRESFRSACVRAVQLIINGETRDISSAGNIAEVIAALGLPAQVTLVEHNGIALRRDEWLTRKVREGDRFELIRIVAGG